jgi:hypothetical protein
VSWAPASIRRIGAGLDAGRLAERLWRTVSVASAPPRGSGAWFGLASWKIRLGKVPDSSTWPDGGVLEYNGGGCKW